MLQYRHVGAYLMAAAAYNFAVGLHATVWEFFGNTDAVQRARGTRAIRLWNSLTASAAPEYDRATGVCIVFPTAAVGERALAVCSRLRATSGWAVTGACTLQGPNRRIAA